MVRFDTTTTWPDGLAVTITTGTAFQPTDLSFAPADGQYLVFTLNIADGSPVTYNPALMRVDAASVGMGAATVLEDGNGLLGPPVMPIDALTERTVRVAFTVTDEADVVLLVRPGPGYDPVRFASAAALGGALPPVEEFPVVDAPWWTSPDGAFGEEFASPDGLVLSVAPAVLTPSDATPGLPPAAPYLRFDITISNQTGSDLNQLFVYTRLHSAGRWIRGAGDAAYDITGDPSVSIDLPSSQSVTIPVGYRPTDPADLLLWVELGDGYGVVAIHT